MKVLNEAELEYANGGGDNIPPPPPPPPMSGLTDAEYARLLASLTPPEKNVYDAGNGVYYAY